MSGRPLLAALIALTAAIPATEHAAHAAGWLGLEVHGAYGAAPGIGGGGGIEVGHRRGSFGAALALRMDRPSEADGVSGSRASVALLGCAWLRRLEACAGIEGGAFDAEGPGLADAHREHAAQLGEVLRLATALEIAHHTDLVPWAMLAVPAIRVTIRDEVSHETYWQQPAVDFAAGLALRTVIR